MISPTLLSLFCAIMLFATFGVNHCQVDFFINETNLINELSLIKNNLISKQDNPGEVSNLQRMRSEPDHLDQVKQEYSTKRDRSLIKNWCCAPFRFSSFFQMLWEN